MVSFLFVSYKKIRARADERFYPEYREIICTILIPNESNSSSRFESFPLKIEKSHN